jgi:hypothetical protein
VVFWWQAGEGDARLVVVNYAPNSGQCYVALPVGNFADGTLELRDLLGPSVYFREKSALLSKGMFFDLQGYGLHIFEVKPA